MNEGGIVAGKPIDEPTRLRVLELLAETGGNKTEVARRLGIDRATVAKHSVAAPAQTPVSQAATDGVEKIRVEESGDSRRVTLNLDHEVRTLEDALRYADVDLAEWRVKKWGVTSWEVTLKVREFDESGKIVGEQPVRRMMWRVTVDLERVMPQPLLKAAEAVFERLSSRKAINFAPPRKKSPPKRPYLLELDLMDHHFGALCWRPETGQDYDLRIAERLFANAVDDLLEAAAPYEVERFLIPIGNDFYHIDNLQQTTTAGTFQDADGRYHKIIEVGEMAMIEAIDRCLKVAPVDLVHVPGNHDRLASWHLCRVLLHHYRGTPDVTVDSGPSPHKFYRYGQTLLGFTHGDEVKPKDMPVLMATTSPTLWAETSHHEWHCGHLHQGKRFDFPTMDTHQGVVVRFLHSLKATDSWHFRKGYLSVNRCAEAYLWDRDRSYAAHFAAFARDS